MNAVDLFIILRSNQELVNKNVKVIKLKVKPSHYQFLNRSAVEANKGQQAMRHVKVINESYTTQACSACGCLSGPTGRTGLVVREWQCGDCGASHDRDINAAINICHLGMKHHPPFAGTSQIQAGVVQPAAMASTGHGFNDCLNQA